LPGGTESIPAVLTWSVWSALQESADVGSGARRIPCRPGSSAAGYLPNKKAKKN